MLCTRPRLTDWDRSPWRHNRAKQWTKRWPINWYCAANFRVSIRHISSALVFSSMVRCCFCGQSFKCGVSHRSELSNGWSRAWRRTRSFTCVQPSTLHTSATSGSALCLWDLIRMSQTETNVEEHRLRSKQRSWIRRGEIYWNTSCTIYSSAIPTWMT